MLHMEISIIAILVAVILQIVLGAIWFGPLFGKVYMKVMGVGHLSKEELSKMNKAMTPAYIIQIITTLIYTNTIGVMAVSGGMPFEMSLVIAGGIVAGIVWPFQISSVIWGQTKKNFWLPHALILMGNSLLSTLIAVFVLGNL